MAGHRTFNPECESSSLLGGTSLVRVKKLAWLLDEALDRLPARESGRWLRYGDWGCRLGLPRYWAAS